MTASLADLPEELVFLILEVGSVETGDAVALRQVGFRFGWLIGTLGYLLTLPVSIDMPAPLCNILAALLLYLRG